MYYHHYYYVSLLSIKTIILANTPLVSIKFNFHRNHRKPIPDVSITYSIMIWSILGTPRHTWTRSDLVPRGSSPMVTASQTVPHIVIAEPMDVHSPRVLTHPHIKDDKDRHQCLVFAEITCRGAHARHCCSNW